MIRLSPVLVIVFTVVVVLFGLQAAPRVQDKTAGMTEAVWAVLNEIGAWACVKPAASS